MFSFLKKYYPARDSKIYWIYKRLLELSDRIEKHHLFLISSGIAFNILLYLIPMFLVAIYLVDLFYNGESLALELEKILTEFLPPNSKTLELVPKITVELRNIIDHSSIAGWIGLASLLWVSSTLISTLRSGLNAIFQVNTQKIFVFYRLKDILLTVVFTFLILLYSYAVPLLTFVISFVTSFTPTFLHSFLAQIALIAFTMISSFVMFYFIYRFVPAKRLPRFVTVNSTIICVILIELSRHLFAWYIGSISNYGKFYGTYAVLVSVAIWIYYSSFILLFSAELIQFLHDVKLRKVGYFGQKRK